MKTYHSKEELKEAIAQTYTKYIAEFKSIPETAKDTRCPEVDRTPAENLAYQVGWTTLLIKWEHDSQSGISVKLPSTEYNWNELGKLYEWFNATYAKYSLEQLTTMLDQNSQGIYQMIDDMTETELFQPHQRAWADQGTKTAVWEVYKYIHINTVAPFTTFRTKIKKWKKLTPSNDL